MSWVFILVGSLLLLVTLGLIYRIFTLVSIAKGNADKPVSTSNKVNSALFPIFGIAGFSAFVWYSGVAKEFFLPEASSVHGVETDWLFWSTMSVIIAVFLIVNFLLFYFPFRYRYSENRKALFYPDNDKIEIIWTVIPAVVMAVLVIMGWRTWADITSPAPEDAVEIEIMGKQFNWQVRYPGKDGELGRYDFRLIDAMNSMGVDFSDKASMDDFLPREIHFPKGKNVSLKIRARDVLHSVFLPHFRVKMDAVPGMQTNFWFVPTKTTAEMREELGDPKFNYELACTEVCGGGHFAMRLKVVVDEPADFEKWVNEQEAWAKKNPDYVSEHFGTGKTDKVAALVISE